MRGELDVKLDDQIATLARFLADGHAFPGDNLRICGSVENTVSVGRSKVLQPAYRMISLHEMGRILSSKVRCINQVRVR